MRFVRASFVIVLITGSLNTGTGAAAQPDPALAAFRTVCDQERARVISDLRQEIKAAQQPAWTPAKEQERLDADFKEAFAVPAEKLQEFDQAWPELWKGATDFLEKPELRLAACAITVVRSWNAGVRDVAQVNQRWATARTAYSSGTAPRATAAGTPVQTSPAPTQPEDPYASAPADCVRLNDTPGSFKNVCDFPVNYTYCGVNPHPESWVTRCDDPEGTRPLDGIAARAVQAAFTRAETMYWFACRKPKVPKDVKFIPGKGLFGTCQ